MKGSRRDFLFWSVKIIAVALSLFYILYNIKSKASLLDDTNRLIEAFSSVKSRGLVISCMILMALNWALEAVKWQRLISNVEEVSFLRAARSVLTGITISFFTPNRVGEFAGRILHLHEGHRIKGALSAFIGSSGQLLITVQAGLIALAIESGRLLHFKPPFQTLIIILCLSSAVVIMLAWFNLPKLAFIFERYKWLRRHGNLAEVFAHFHDKDLGVIYFISLLRYIVFCSQQFLLLKIFSVEIDYLTCIEFSAISFLLITLIPSIAIGELGVRGGINIWVFGKIIPDATAILITTFSLWCINLALPALVGALSLLYVRIWKDH